MRQLGQAVGETVQRPVAATKPEPCKREYERATPAVERIPTDHALDAMSRPLKTALGFGAAA